MRHAKNKAPDGNPAPPRGDASSSIVETGPCFEHVLGAVENDVDADAASQLRRRASSTVAKIVTAYVEAFGSGDVGATGSGHVAKVFTPTVACPIGPGTNGLIYGKVQSGKTNLTIATVALALANGFKVIVVLTSDNTWLGKQTYKRFRDALVNAGPKVVLWDDWRRDPKGRGDHLRQFVEDVGIVLVCTKNVKNLEAMVDVLRHAQAKRAPGLIIDDEADNASLNTKESQKGKKAVDPSRVFEMIGDVRANIPNHVYLQVTATPQSLLLQTLDNPLRPSFSIIADPGQGYVGGQQFFELSTPYVHVIDADELDYLKGGEVTVGDACEMPAGLRLAVCCFILGAAYKMQGTDEHAKDVYSMLVHVCHKKINHETIAHLLEEFLPALWRALGGKNGPKKLKEALGWLNDARVELEKTVPELPPQEDLIAILSARLAAAMPQVINADNPNAEPEYRPGMNFLIGGNRLGRGVTIKGLMITYYGRDAKQKMTDTVHQHARMFGYREHLLDVTRLFSAQHILDSFGAIHDADEGTRAIVGAAPDLLHIKPVWVGHGLRPTRSNVLNPSAIGAIPPGKLIFPPRPRYKRQDVQKHTLAIDEMLKGHAPGQFLSAPIDMLMELLERMPSIHVPEYSWEDDRVRQMLRALAAPPINIAAGWLQVLRRDRDDGLQRAGSPQSYLQSSGYLSGPETSAARARADHAPVLVLTRQRGRAEKGWDEQPFYAPTLFVPRTRFAFMFSYH